jgi:L-2-hydroxyglutarate oxidase LhgO
MGGPHGNRSRQRGMDKVDAVVVGAGVVGLAVARALARRGLETLVLEQDSGIGTGISARNSEVIHAGIYYPRDSLKARLCVRGKALLYAHCERHGVPHRRCGKLIVATAAAQQAELQRLRAAGQANGVDDLVLLDGAAARAMEPALQCTAALYSPSTGIVDSHALMLSLQGELEAAGGAVVLASPLQAGTVTPDGLVLQVGGREPCELATRLLVNAAGLQAQAVAHSVHGLDAVHVPPRFLARGHYFSLSGRSPFSRLIYPVPEPGGLGVHLTLDLGGQARFGPDVQWVDDLSYDVDPGRAPAFEAAIRPYWPDLPAGALQPAYAGIRPKIVGPGRPAADFLIQDATVHGVPGLVNLFGIESPGLTAALAIGERVAGAV